MIGCAGQDNFCLGSGTCDAKEAGEFDIALLSGIASAASQTEVVLPYIANHGRYFQNYCFTVSLNGVE